MTWGQLKHLLTLHEIPDNAELDISVFGASSTLERIKCTKYDLKDNRVAIRVEFHPADL